MPSCAGKARQSPALPALLFHGFAGSVNGPRNQRVIISIDWLSAPGGQHGGDRGLPGRRNSPLIVPALIGVMSCQPWRGRKRVCDPARARADLTFSGFSRACPDSYHRRGRRSGVNAERPQREDERRRHHVWRANDRMEGDRLPAGGRRRADHSPAGRRHEALVISASRGVRAA